jgi:pyrimidine operon attenuation protein/uracil phosphoribosyltransferase
MAGRLLLDEDAITRTLRRLAHEIVERNADPSVLAVVGIHTRGAVLAGRLRDMVGEITGTTPARGNVDIAFYRDDVGRGRRPGPVVHQTDLGFAPDGMRVVIVDDVLFTGRTVRAAIEALFDYGRPPVVQLCVLVDRGHRELPIRPDFVGKNLPTRREERVTVRLREIDGEDAVWLEGEE